MLTYEQHTTGQCHVFTEWTSDDDNMKRCEIRDPDGNQRTEITDRTNKCAWVLFSRMLNKPWDATFFADFWTAKDTAKLIEMGTTVGAYEWTIGTVTHNEYA